MWISVSSILIFIKNILLRESQRVINYKIKKKNSYNLSKYVFCTHFIFV